MKNTKISQADANALLSIATELSIAMKVNCVKFPYMDADTGLPIGGSIWKDLCAVLDRIQKGAKQEAVDASETPIVVPESTSTDEEAAKAAMAAEAEAALKALGGQ